MLEFIMDFVFDIILEGSAIVMSEKKVPMPIRVIAFCFVVILYLGISGICFLASIDFWMDNGIVASIVFFAVGLFILIGGFFQMRKELKKRNKEKGDIYEKN